MSGKRKDELMKVKCFCRRAKQRGRIGSVENLVKTYHEHDVVGDGH
jgi:hypothetical protein